MGATLLAHEWLAPHGGSENVFEQMMAALPGARMQCLWNDAPERFGSAIDETWLARTPLRRSKAAALPLMPLAWDRVDLTGVDRVVVSSHAFAHQLAWRAARSGRDAFAYVHTPARYVWTPELDPRGAGAAARLAATALKPSDRRRTSDGVRYAANSEYVRARIRETWGRDAEVIYPTVAVERIQSRSDWSAALGQAEAGLWGRLPGEFVLGASRLVEYKRLDVAMRVGEALDLPVVIAGAGPDEERIRAEAERADVPVTFVGRVSDEMLYALYQRCALFVFMAIEDFGIMPVEAMALGAPVLVNAQGGASESVVPLGGGCAVDASADPRRLSAVAKQALDGRGRAVEAVRERFGAERFRRQIAAWTGEADAA